MNMIFIDFEYYKYQMIIINEMFFGGLNNGSFDWCE